MSGISVGGYGSPRRCNIALSNRAYCALMDMGAAVRLVSVYTGREHGPERRPLRLVEAA